jgi:hypothetical protein
MAEGGHLSSDLGRPDHGGRDGPLLPILTENAGGSVLVGVLGISALRLLSYEFGALGLEGIGNVLEENQTEDDVLVLRGVHVVAERICHAPQLRFLDTRKSPIRQVKHLGNPIWGGPEIMAQSEAR